MPRGALWRTGQLTDEIVGSSLLASPICADAMHCQLIPMCRLQILVYSCYIRLTSCSSDANLFPFRKQTRVCFKGPKGLPNEPASVHVRFTSLPAPAYLLGPSVLSGHMAGDTQKSCFASHPSAPCSVPRSFLGSPVRTFAEGRRLALAKLIVYGLLAILSRCATRLATFKTSCFDIT